MSAHILNISTEKINRVRRVRFSSRDSGTVEVLRTILVLRAHMTVRMRHFHGIWIPDGRCASNKGSSGRSAVKWRKVVKKTLRIAVLCGENCTLLALFIFSTKIFKICALFLGHFVLVCILTLISASREEIIVGNKTLIFSKCFLTCHVFHYPWYSFIIV
jgi:hypothetical protein